MIANTIAETYSKLDYNERDLKKLIDWLDDIEADIQLNIVGNDWEMDSKFDKNQDYSFFQRLCSVLNRFKIRSEEEDCV